MRVGGAMEGAPFSLVMVARERKGMNFRCYTCSLVMSEGIPPIEALSPRQFSCVGADYIEGDRRFDALLGTSYEGLSVYNFCAFCFTVITEFPSQGNCDIEYTRTKEWRDDIQFIGRRCDAHDWEARKTIDMAKEESFTKFDDVLLTRRAMFHRIEMVYCSADLSGLQSLLEMEV